MADKKVDLTISDYNLKKLSTKELERHLASTIEFGENVFLCASRGTGKTMISKQAIKKAGFQEVYLNMSVLERTDFGGYPDILSPNRKSDFIGHIMPAYLAPFFEGGRKK